jgi:hypothetical protein
MPIPARRKIRCGHGRIEPGAQSSATDLAAGDAELRPCRRPFA